MGPGAGCSGRLGARGVRAAQSMPESSFSQERQSDQSMRSPSRLQSMPLPPSLVATAPFYLTPRPAESDPAAFSSDLTHLVPAQDDLALFQKGNFVRMDPPRHRKLRGLVSQAFTPRMVAGLEPRIAEVTTELLDATGGGERLDLIESLAYPRPVIVIAELLGIPSTDRPTFRRWADTLLDEANIDPEDSLQKVGAEAVASVPRRYGR